MKYVILSEYDDKKLSKRVKVDDILELDDDRVEELMEVGIELEEFIEDDKDLSFDDVLANFKEDKETVSTLKADMLKLLCEKFEIDYTNVGEAKTALLEVEIEE